jgi:hypothetical protein
MIAFIHGNYAHVTLQVTATETAYYDVTPSTTSIDIEKTSNVPPSTTLMGAESTFDVSQSTTSLDSEYNQCGVAFNKSGISLMVRGDVVHPNAWPWVVALYRNHGKGIKFECGGTLVTRKHVITGIAMVL